MTRTDLLTCMDAVSDHVLAQSERRASAGAERKRARTRWLAAACLLLAVGLGAWGMLTRGSPAPVDPPEGTLPASRDPITAPQDVERFTAPELETLYQTEPYSRLLPQKIPAGLTFRESFLTDPDPVGDRYLALSFSSNRGTLEIKVASRPTDRPAADPTDPGTYRLDLYYGPQERDGTVGAELPDVFRPIQAADFSEEIAAARIYTFRSGQCQAQVDLICGDYMVSYNFSGDPIHPDLFLECVTSSPYMQAIR